MLSLNKNKKYYFFKNSIFYVADSTSIFGINLNLEILFSWDLPEHSEDTFRGLKLDETILYLTIDGIHQIFLCNSLDGKVLKRFGNDIESLKPGEFHLPYGITIDCNNIIICDCVNHRVQTVTKDEGIFIRQWGKGSASTDYGNFQYPLSIFNDSLEEIFYIGDECSVQLFTRNGICVQRLGDKQGNLMYQFTDVDGLCIMDGCLYVSDSENQRIMIFQKIAKT